MMDTTELSKCLSYFTDRVRNKTGEKELVDAGGLVVGTFCNFVPEELIWAVGARSIRLCGGCSEHEEQGSQLVSRDLCPVATSAAGLPQLSPELWKRIDLLVIPAVCDAKKKLAEAFGQGKPVHVLDVPTLKDSEPARAYWLGEVQRLAERIEQASGSKIARAPLEEAIRLSMKREALFRDLLELRYGQNRDGALMTGQEFQFVTGASFADEPRRYTEQLDTLVHALRQADSAGYRAVGPGAPRLVLAGAPLIYPNFCLLDIIHEGGGVVVADSSCSATQSFYQHLAPRDWSRREMIRALAERSNLPCMCPCFSSTQERSVWLQELVSASQADGIVFHQLHRCALFAAEGEFLRRELGPTGLPLLVVSADYAVGATARLRVRIEAFLEMIQK